MRIVEVVGARPQFIKAAPVDRALRQAGHDVRLVHTGQHYDDRMSEIFFRELNLPRPDRDLGVGSGPHGKQTGEMLALAEAALEELAPDRVLVYGDTNSTLAGALAACKLRIPLAHVEAGLRSFNRDMPEEHNRVLTDHAADLLLCPTETAMRNLSAEGLRERARLVGDTMCDLLLASLERVERSGAELLARIGLEPGGYALATVHRAYNTDNPETLRGIVEALARLDDPVVLPLHPRTRRALERHGLMDPGRPLGNLLVTEPVGYLDMLALQRHARLVLTDSGGVQKEAFLLSVPCVTLRPETEWVETVESGWNVVAGTRPEDILAAAGRAWPSPPSPSLFGEGDAAERIVRVLEAC